MSEVAYDMLHNMLCILLEGMPLTMQHHCAILLTIECILCHKSKAIPQDIIVGGHHNCDTRCFCGVFLVSMLQEEKLSYEMACASVCRSQAQLFRARVLKTTYS